MGGALFPGPHGGPLGGPLRLRVCLFVDRYLPSLGGVQLATHRLAMALQREGCEPVVFAPSAVAAPYRIVRYRPSPFKRLGATFLALQLLRAWRRDRFQLLHCQGQETTGFPGALFCRLTGVPLVITPRGSNLRRRGLKGRWVNRRVARSLRSARAVTALSRRIRQEVVALGVPEDRVVLIPHGIDPADVEGVEPFDPGYPYVLALGRFRRFKGFDLLIRAFGLMLDRCPDARLILAGDGKLGPQLRELARPLGERVVFAGPVAGERKFALLKGCRLFAFPSRPGREGFPNALLEAMACGAPVVATAVSGAEDLLEEGGGVLVPPEDPEALAEAMLELWRDGSRRARLAEDARRVAARYHISDIARRYVEVYARCLR